MNLRKIKYQLRLLLYFDKRFPPYREKAFGEAKVKVVRLCEKRH